MDYMEILKGKIKMYSFVLAIMDCAFKKGICTYLVLSKWDGEM